MMALIPFAPLLRTELLSLFWFVLEASQHDCVSLFHYHHSMYCAKKHLFTPKLCNSFQQFLVQLVLQIALMTSHVYC